jgi:hypothetical protein
MVLKDGSMLQIEIQLLENHIHPITFIPYHIQLNCHGACSLWKARWVIKHHFFKMLIEGWNEWNVSVCRVKWMQNLSCVVIWQTSTMLSEWCYICSINPLQRSYSQFVNLDARLDARLVGLQGGSMKLFSAQWSLALIILILHHSVFQRKFWHGILQ